MSIAVIKQYDQKQLEEERKGLRGLDTAHREGKSEQELKAVTWNQELKQKPWRNAAHWLAFSWGFNLLPRALLASFTQAAALEQEKKSELLQLEQRCMQIHARRFLIHSRTTCPTMAPPTVGWVPPINH